MLLWMLSYAWVALLLGLGLLAMAAYTAFDANYGGPMAQETALTSANGPIAPGHHVTAERERHPGGHDEASDAGAARLPQEHADGAKAAFTSEGMIGLALMLALLGGGGLWWRRKLLAQEPEFAITGISEAWR
jgi:hypothetical protein